VAQEVRIELPPDHRVLLDGEDVTDAIRTTHVTQITQYAAGNPAVRERLVVLQRQLGDEGRIVAEGRDQGTVVFPHAPCKFFVTASPQERARRRQAELLQRGEDRPLDEVLADQNARDARDAGRKVGPLKQAADATLILTDGLSPSEVVDRLEKLVRAKM
jgi:cytidylate kinase